MPNGMRTFCMKSCLRFLIYPYVSVVFMVWLLAVSFPCFVLVEVGIQLIYCAFRSICEARPFKYHNMTRMYAYMAKCFVAVCQVRYFIFVSIKSLKVIFCFPNKYGPYKHHYIYHIWVGMSHNAILSKFGAHLFLICKTALYSVWHRESLHVMSELLLFVPFASLLAWSLLLNSCSIPKMSGLSYITAKNEYDWN